MGKKLFFSVLLLAALSFVTADSLFALLESDGVSVTVPDFCGVQEDTVVPPEWMLLQTEYRYDSEIPAGTVISQLPVGGTVRKLREKRSCEVTLTVSLGAEAREVPAVAGLDARIALAELRRQGFSVLEETVYGGTDGTVQRTEPPAGSRVSLGGTVTVYVGACQNAEAITVPALTGLSRGNALLQIFLSGLSAGEVTEEASELPDGTVIRHSPAAGSLVMPGTKIKLVISKQLSTSE